MPAIDLLAELFEPVRGVTIRRMFGGLGVFKDGLMFALVADDLLYFKADEKTAPRFEQEGFGQWVYEGRGRKVPMPYWRAPDRLYDEPDEFADWARAAFAVAQRTQKAKGGKRPARKPKAVKKAPAKPTRKAVPNRR